MSSAPEIIALCLDVVPIPGLRASFTLLRFIWNTVQTLQGLKEQMVTLSAAAADLLRVVNLEHVSKRLIEANTIQELKSLHRLITDISESITVYATYGLLKLIFRRNDTVNAIDQFHRRIAATVHAFNITSLLNIQEWQARNTLARVQDEDALHARLNTLEANQNQLAELLNSQHSSVIAMMVSLQKSLEKNLVVQARERQFLSHSLNYLASTSREHVKIESWTVTSFEVEFGQEIGSGGFGKVFKGTWNKTTVALKVLRDSPAVIPSASTIRREIETWSNIRHPHVLQFLGANIFDDHPFIVMPYMKNGNARDYILAHPSCNRLKLLHHVSLGLLHLHSQNVIHGDLKALNVLIDDAENAVLCDFGLSRVKADASSRSIAPTKSSSVAGSRNWMAPERLLGGSLRKSVDIYAFGMTIFEIYSTEVPFGHVPYEDLISLVVNHNIRPQRPEPEESPELTDEVWSLAERCWLADPKSRPDTVAICDEIEQLVINSPRIESSEPEDKPPLPIKELGPAMTWSSLGSDLTRVDRSVGDRPLPELPTARSVPLYQTWDAHYTSLPAYSSANLSPPPHFASAEHAALALPPLRPLRAPGSPTKQILHPGNLEQHLSPTPLFPGHSQTWPSGSTAVNSSTHQLPKKFTSKAKVLYDYQASVDDPNELSLKKGELIDVVKTDEEWWIARRPNGAQGIAPRNYLKETTSDDTKTEKKDSSQSSSKLLNLFAGNKKQPKPHPSPSHILPTSRLNYTYTPIAVTTARARHSYQASPLDTHELSFTAGEILHILDAAEAWWIVRKADMSEGSE